MALLLGVSANESHCTGLAPGPRAETNEAAFSSVVAKVPGEMSVYFNQARCCRNAVGVLLSQ